MHPAQKIQVGSNQLPSTESPAPTLHIPCKRQYRVLAVSVFVDDTRMILGWFGWFRALRLTWRYRCDCVHRIGRGFETCPASWGFRFIGSKFSLRVGIRRPKTVRFITDSGLNSHACTSDSTRCFYNSTAFTSAMYSVSNATLSNFQTAHKFWNV